MCGAPPARGGGFPGTEPSSSGLSEPDTACTRGVWCGSPRCARLTSPLLEGPLAPCPQAVLPALAEPGRAPPGLPRWARFLEKVPRPGPRRAVARPARALSSRPHSCPLAVWSPCSALSFWLLDGEGRRGKGAHTATGACGRQGWRAPSTCGGILHGPWAAAHSPGVPPWYQEQGPGPRILEGCCCLGTGSGAEGVDGVGWTRPRRAGPPFPRGHRGRWPGPLCLLAHQRAWFLGPRTGLQLWLLSRRGERKGGYFVLPGPDGAP